MVLGCIALGLLYYKNLVVSLIFLPFGVIWVKSKEIEFQNKKKANVTEQFIDFLQSLKSSLAAGSNLEKAVRRAPKDIKVIWENSDEIINLELDSAINRLNNNVSIEESLIIMANKLQIDEAKEFATSIKMCHRNGGNINEAVGFSTEALQQQLLLSREFELAIAEKQVESKILLIMPHILLLILNVTTGDYISPLYTTWIGRGIMTVSLLIIGGAWYATKRIIK